ncbi:hypothetical protein NQ314_021158, partial [Rhamnusium bicolor]
LDVIYSSNNENIPKVTNDGVEDFDNLDNEDEDFDNECDVVDEFIVTTNTVVIMFKRSPTKNMLLLNYVKQEFGKELNLLLDCRTRWSSLSIMIERFIQLRSCISKVLIDLELGSDYWITEDEFNILSEIDRALQPIKLAVEVLCRQDSNLRTAEITLRFTIDKLQLQKTSLSEKLVSSLSVRIKQRRTNLTSVFIYLQNPSKYLYDLKDTNVNEIFSLPSKSRIIKEMVNLLEREDVDVGGLDRGCCVEMRKEHQKNLLAEIAVEDPESYRNHLRMSENQFEELSEKVKSKIEKQNTIMREALPSRLKLQITLRYLATGDTYGTLEALYRVPRCSIGRFVPEVCKAIWEVLEEYIKVPTTAEEWKVIMENYNSLWNFPNCCGAMDGKHVVIRCPANTGSEYYNYKHTFSIILFAIVDANYNFLYLDVGTNGRANDASVFSKTQDSVDTENWNTGSINLGKMEKYKAWWTS